MPIDPRMDGVTHVNVYSKGATSIGRFLSNFAHAPFSLPEHGTFASLEGYWYWLSVEDDRLRHLYGYQAKKLGQDIRRRHSGGQRGDFKDLILEAIRAKLRAHRDRWPELAATGDLPLLHYYVFNGKVKDVTAGNQWQLDEIARIRTILIDRARGD